MIRTVSTQNPTQNPIDPTLPVEQFTVLLRELALRGDPSRRTRVSTEGLAGEEEDLYKVIILLGVCEGTGFKVTLGRFLLETQWLIFLLFNYVTGNSRPEEWHYPTNGLTIYNFLTLFAEATAGSLVTASQFPSCLPPGPCQVHC